jgi:gliding motility-associated-like protein
MKKLNLLFLFLFSGFGLNSQITVNNSTSPINLVQTVLVGSGVVVSNFTYNGSVINALQPRGNVASFNANGTSFPIESGVLLTTGMASVAVGPNNQFGATEQGTTQQVTDPDLLSISGFSLGNGVVLEFDFVPVGDTIRFNYIFGSEEYPDYVNQGFNDAFGFFLTGPGINGTFQNNGVNLARVPGTNIPVTIDNVNNGNGNNGPCVNCAYYVNNTNGMAYGNAIQFNGTTTLLEAVSPVQCGETYHIKLAIANVGDFSFDSGVFLEANSFSSQTVNVAVTTVTGDNTIVEGCTEASIVFSRPPSQTGEALEIHYNIEGTAIEGEDYNFLPNPIVFQPGESTVTLTVVPTDDGIEEGTETIVLTVFTDVCNETIESTATLFIVDQSSYSIEINQPVINCSQDSVLVSATIQGGVPDFQYLWSNGMTTSQGYFHLNSSELDTIHLTVTDHCGVSNSESRIVQLDTTISFSSITQIPSSNCFGTGSVVANINGIDDSAVIRWSGPGADSDNFILSNSWSNIVSGMYYVDVSFGRCRIEDSIFVEFESDSIFIDSMSFVPTSPCFHTGSVFGSADRFGVLGDISYSWSGPGTTNPNSVDTNVWENLASGAYYLTATLGNCSVLDSIFVAKNGDSLFIDSMSFISTDYCFYTGSLFGTAENLTGQGDVSYVWSGPGENNPNSINQNFWTDLDSGMYYLTATVGTCSITDSIFLSRTNNPLRIDSMSFMPTEYCFPTGELFGTAENLSGQGDISYTWSGPGENSLNFVSSNQWSALDSGMYYLNASLGNCLVIDSLYLGRRNDSLQIDSLSIIDRTYCAADGSLFVSFLPTNDGLSFEWSGPNFDNPGTIDTRFWNELDSGYYSFTANLGYCQLRDTVFLDKTLDSMYIDTIIQLPKSLCGEDGVVIGEVLGVQGLPLYTWSGPGNDSPNTINSNIYNGLDSGYYYFSATYGICSVFDSVFVEAGDFTLELIGLNQFPSSSCGFTGEVNAELTVMNATPTYLWSGPGTENPSTSDSIAFINISSGVYYFSATYFSCFVEGDIFLDEIQEELIIDFITQTPTSFCFDDGTISAQAIGVSGNPTYNWTGPIPLNTYSLDSSFADSLPMGTYVLTATFNNCQVTDNITVLRNDDTLFISQLEQTPSSVCEDNGTVFGEAEVNNQIGDISYEWSDLEGDFTSATNTMNDLPAGTYYLTATYFNCEARDTIDVIQNTDSLQILSMTQIPSSPCFDSGSLLGEAGGVLGQATYNWSGPNFGNLNNIDSDTWAELPSGMYYFSATYGTCQITDSLFLENNNDTLFISQLEQTPSSVCEDNGTVFGEAEVNNQIGDISYEWSDLEGNLTSVTNTMEDLPAGTYYLTATYFNCEARDTIDVIQNTDSLQILSMTQIPSSPCFDSGSLLGEAGGVLGQATYNWSGPNFGNPNNIDSDTWAELPSGMYYFSATYGTCQITDSLFLENNNDTLFISQLEQTPSSVCEDNGTVFGEAEVNNQIGDISYQWSDLEGDFTSATNTMGDLPSGTYYLTATYFNCEARDTIEVIQNTDSLEINIMTQTPSSFCEDNGSVFGLAEVENQNGNITYQWTDLEGNFTSTTNTMDNLPAGEYFLTANYLNCTANGSIVVMQNTDSLVLDGISQNSTESCVETGSVTANASGVNGAISYTWSGPGVDNPTTFNSNSWTNIGSGMYYLTIVYGTCTLEDSIFVEQDVAPVANFTATPDSGPIVLPVEFTNLSQNATSFFWNFGNGETLVMNDLSDVSTEYEDINDYTVTLIATLGQCSDTFLLVISTTPVPLYDPIIIIPNVFSPNDDGINDFFYLSTENIKSVELQIFNRWGILMYEGNGINAKWDGKAQSGKEASEGTYFIKYSIVGHNGVPVSGNAYFELKR